jgi:hypothetical protein
LRGQGEGGRAWIFGLWEGLGRRRNVLVATPTGRGRFYTVTRQFGYVWRVAIGPYLYLAIVRNAF